MKTKTFEKITFGIADFIVKLILSIGFLILYHFVSITISFEYTIIIVLSLISTYIVTKSVNNK